MIERKRIGKGGRELIELIPETEEDALEIARQSEAGTLDARESFADSRSSGAQLEDVAFSASAALDVLQLSLTAAQYGHFLTALRKELEKSLGSGIDSSRRQSTLSVPRQDRGRLTFHVWYSVVFPSGTHQIQVASIEPVVASNSA
jgi:hypothetical protein